MMKNVKDFIEEFKHRAIEHYRYGLAGDYKQGNKNIEQINKLYDDIKKQDGLSELLTLVNSDMPEVVSLAATYCLSHYPEICLPVFEKLSMQNIPLISTGAEYAIKNWENDQWYIH